MRAYPYRVVMEEDVYVLDIPDFPTIHSWAESEEDAHAQVVDAIETSFIGHMKTRKPIPAASAAREGDQAALIPTLSVMKADLWNAMLEAGMNKAEFARRLDVRPIQVDRILDVRNATRVDALDAAAQALGGLAFTSWLRHREDLDLENGLDVRIPVVKRFAGVGRVVADQGPPEPEFLTVQWGDGNSTRYEIAEAEFDQVSGGITTRTGKRAAKKAAWYLKRGAEGTRLAASRGARRQTQRPDRSTPSDQD